MFAGGPAIADEFITLARVLKVQGRRGEVLVEPLSDVPDRFRVGLELLALGENEARRELRVEELWPHKNRLALKFVGVNSISDAEALVGSELQVPRDERAQLEPGWTYVSDLVGCVVFDHDRKVGLVEDVQFGAGEAPLLIVKAGGKVHQIPYAEAYLQSVDLGQKEIRMLLPDGMLEIDAPLTAEEKQQQKR
ncbi:MAG TPA: ribosome maturation factor RimM [Terriglobales bacterium]|nr:ribosome maturation factor RimM [Terriglobales bacterium]